MIKNQSSRGVRVHGLRTHLLRTTKRDKDTPFLWNRPESPIFRGSSGQRNARHWSPQQPADLTPGREAWVAQSLPSLPPSLGASVPTRPRNSERKKQCGPAAPGLEAPKGGTRQRPACATIQNLRARVAMATAPVARQPGSPSKRGEQCGSSSKAEAGDQRGYGEMEMQGPAPWPFLSRSPRSPPPAPDPTPSPRRPCKRCHPLVSDCPTGSADVAAPLIHSSCLGHGRKAASSPGNYCISKSPQTIPLKSGKGKESPSP